MLPGRRLTVLVIPEAGGHTYEYKVSGLLLWLALALGLVVVALLVVGTGAWVEARHLARRVERLSRDKAILSEEVERIEDLEVALRRLQASNRRLRRITAEAVGLRPRAPRQLGERARPQVIDLSDRLRFGTLHSVPTLQPVAATERRPYDGGILLVAPRGSLVSAAAAGQVIQTGYDRDLGFHLVVDHRNGVRSTYAGLAWLIAREGAYVQKGQPLGLTGWPGKGRTPGLRFAVIEDGREVTAFLSPLWL